MHYDLNALEFEKILARLSGYAKTNYAKELINELVPSNDFDEVIRLNEETKEAYNASVRLSDVPLGGLYEVNSSIKRAKIGGVLEPNELLNIVGLIDCGNNVIKYFKSLESIKENTPRLLEYVNKITNYPTLKATITLAISNDGKVNDNASRELFTIRRSISSLNNRLRSKLNELLSSKAGMLTEQLIVMRNNRMCLPVKIEYKNSFKGIIHDISSSNTTCYIEPETCVETANQIDSYIAAEKKEIQIILKNLSLLVSSEADGLIQNLDSLTSLDVIYAKALMAKSCDYHPVKITNDYSFSLKKAKHPLIDPDKVVPIDVELGKKASTIIITGPNTGGKTVALKTIGLLHIMMMCGMMIPANPDSSLSVFSEVLVDIGDEQSIEQSLSTFSAHLTKMISILEKTSFESLVLLDELGSGTDPKEGSSLAISMIDYIKTRGAKLLVTTHYSDLKTYAYETDNILNASVEFNSNTLMPTYRLLIGVPGRSNAIEIAARLGLPETIIADSRRRMEGQTTSSGALMSNLEEEMTKIREMEEDLQHKIEVYEGKAKEVSLEKLRLSKEADKILLNAKKEAAKIVEDSKEEANELISKLSEMAKAEYKEHELADLKHRVRNMKVDEKDNILFDEELVVGDYVFIKSFEKNGTITKIKKDKYSVQMGQFTMDFNKNDLIKAVKPKEKIVKQTRMSGYNPASHVGLSLDLRGKRYEEVEFLMDQYLDQAILGNLEQVSIIHGFGTGTIRNAVQAYLKKCPYVKSFRYGQEGEGLNGVTVVKLK